MTPERAVESPDEGVGVGPHPEPWPDDPRFDRELLERGDRRNVVDRYRYWTVEAIVADLDARRHPFHVAIENWRHDLNIGTVVRTGEGLPLVVVDNLPGSVPLETVELPRRCVLVFGQEGPGLSVAARAACAPVCSIAMFGSTRSINAGVASGIAMHAWIRQHAL